MNRFEAQGLSGNFEFEADQEFDGAELEGADFGEAEFDGGELEGEWDGEVRDHRRRPPPQTAARVRDHRRPAAYRSGTRPSQWSSRSRSYAAPRSAQWGARTGYGSRPSYRSSYSPWSRSSYSPWSRSSTGLSGQRYRSGQQPGLSSRWYGAANIRAGSGKVSAFPAWRRSGRRGARSSGAGTLGPPAPPLSLWHRRIGLRAAFHLRRA